MKVLHELQYEMRKLVLKLLVLLNKRISTSNFNQKTIKRAPKGADINLRKNMLHQFFREIKRDSLVIQEIHGN